MVEEFLGLDIGDKRIGVARGSSVAKIAEPLLTIHSDNAISEVQKLIDQIQPIAVVVGLPRNLNGEETAQTIKVREWVNRAKEVIDKTFYFQDEALTSVEAHNSLPGKKDPGIDAKAAAVILQDFLDSSETGRIVG